MKKRILFPRNKQRLFLEDSISQLNLNWKELANELSTNSKTISTTHRFEKSRLPYKVFLDICKLTGENPYIILKRYQGKITNDGVLNPRKVIGDVRKELHQMKIFYKNDNYNLNTKDIKFSMRDKEKNIRLPKKITALLAEEVGIHLGDGYLSNRKTEYRLKGNRRDEKEYYDNFVKALYKKLFNINLNLKEYETTYGFELHSNAIHDFKSKTLGLRQGKKDNIEIPKRLKINDVSIVTALLRGIFDTDGNIYFQSRYGYKNYYPHISIGQKSKKLIKEIHSTLKMLGFNPCLHVREDFSSLSLYGYKSLKRFIDLIGFNNPKHFKKIEMWKKRHPYL